MTNPFYTATGNPPAQTRGVSSTQRAEFSLIQSAFSLLPVTAYAVDTGAANAYVIAVNPGVTFYSDGLGIIFKASNANMGASTVNVNGVGAVAIVHGDGTALQVGDIYAGQFIAAYYNATSGKFVFGGPAMGQILADINAQISAAQFATTLPSQTGNSGKYITTNGATASWGTLLPPAVIRSVRTSNIILTVVDQATLVDITSGAFSQTFTPQATLGSGWYVFLRNAGTGNITLTPAGGLIDGLSSYVMYPQECRLIQCDGTNFNSIILHPYTVDFTITGTWTIPPGYCYHSGLAWSGGASGQRTNSTSSQSNGGGGGGCGPFTFQSGMLGTSQAITIGAGGVAVSGASPGNAGGNTTIGSLFSVYANSSFTYGGSIINGSNVNQAYNFGGGAGGASTAATVYGGDGTNSTGQAAGSIYGGGAGGSLSSAAAVLNAGVSVFGGSGGASSSASSGTAGAAPGGGGGATQTGASSGAGARGEVRIWGVV
jgi:hypothetical protein